MKNIKCLFFALAASLLIVACKKKSGSLNCETQNEGAYSGIPGTYLGEWVWESTSGGFTGRTHDTPASTGKNITLRITQDHHYRFYLNGVVSNEGTYRTESKRCIHGGQQKTFIVFSASQSLMVERLKEPVLTLSDDAFDGFTSIYKRK